MIASVSPNLGTCPVWGMFVAKYPQWLTQMNMSDGSAEVFEFRAGVSLEYEKLVPPYTVNDGGEMSFCPLEKSHRIQCRCRRPLRAG